MDDHQFPLENVLRYMKLEPTCAQIALTCLYLASIGRPDLHSTVNKLSRSVTKWIKACDENTRRRLDAFSHPDDENALLLVCVSLIFLMMCCGNVLVMPPRFLACSPLCGRRLVLLCGFPLCWLLHVTFRSCRRQPLHEHVCLFIVKSIKPSAAVRTAPRRIFFRPPLGLERSNPY